MGSKSDNQWEKFLSKERVRGSNYKRSDLDEFYSDRTRILSSSYFRRMQQKAQVFSLEFNSSVRSRLTHSLEVSDIGRRLAVRIVDELSKEKLLQKNIPNKYALKEKDKAKFIAVIENACLMHDIGNPPFGHFGEVAIKKWWIANEEKYIEKYNENAKNNDEPNLDF